MNSRPTVGVVGLGYVGLPLAVELARTFEVRGIDIDESRIQELKKGKDRTDEVNEQDLQDLQTISFHVDPSVISECDVVIVAVPTPITSAKQPDLSPLKAATKTVGQHLKRGVIVSFESTVYPGVTEGVCVEILENESGLTYMNDFKVGYSPERVNPGDKQHTIDKIVKVVSGCDEETLEVLSEVYGAMTSAGVFKATSIQVAESAKVIENIQRDVNIALMNELKMIFDKLDIDVQDVLAASETKWNFLPFYPGLVGGHCIGVDPYYLAQKATEIGVHPQMILSGRRINDEMPHYHAGQVVKDMIERELTVKGANVCVLGATFKPDVPDLRNSKVEDLVRDLSSFGCNVTICEPEFPERAEIFGCKTVSVPEVMTTQFEYVVRAVNHEVFSKLAVHYTIGASSAERAAKQAEQSRTMRTVSDTTEPVSA